MKVAGIYLAAGQSRRMGAPKLSLELSAGKTLGSVALEQLSNCGIDPLIVVVRADDPLEWLPVSSKKPVKWRTETCFTAHLGLSFSLRCGLSAIMPSDPDAILVALADQPFVQSRLIERLVSAMHENPKLDYAASGNGGKPMPPALFARTMFPVLGTLNGDKGAREIFESPDYQGIVIDPEDYDFFMDVDTEEDFERVKKQYELNTNYTVSR